MRLVHFLVSVDPLTPTSVPLDAPVFLLVDVIGALDSHFCRQVGLDNAEPPKMEGWSNTRSLFAVVVRDTVGFRLVPLFVALVGIGFVWFTPKKEYAPTANAVEPPNVTTILPVVLLGFFRYQNSASLLVKCDMAFVSDVPPNVTDETDWLFALIPTRSSLLGPAPVVKLNMVAC